MIEVYTYSTHFSANKWCLHVWINNLSAVEALSNCALVLLFLKRDWNEGVDFREEKLNTVLIHFIKKIHSLKWQILLIFSTFYCIIFLVYFSKKKKLHWWSKCLMSFDNNINLNKCVLGHVMYVKNVYSKQNNWISLKFGIFGEFLPLDTGNWKYIAHCQMKLKYIKPFYIARSWYCSWFKCTTSSSSWMAQCNCQLMFGNSHFVVFLICGAIFLLLLNVLCISLTYIVILSV